jgi:predicted ATPase
MTKHNLHQIHPPDIYIGREIQTVNCLKLLLEDGKKLITITGEAGIGKTTFATFLAHWLIQRAKFDAIYFIELATAKDINDLFSKIANTLNIEFKIDLSGIAQENIPEAEFEQRKNQLRQRLSSNGKILLILDNFENLLNDDLCSFLIKNLTTISNLYLLITSRPALKITGVEKEFELPPLTKDEAKELFKKLSADKRKITTKEDESYIDKICKIIHYNPLAIELVSQHANMGFKNLFDKLGESRLSLQRADRRGVGERFKDMAISLEFSYNLLDENSKRLFILLSVFRGRFTLEAVENISVVSTNKLNKQAVWEYLERLSNWKLIKQEDNRYYLLETIREYAGLILDKEGKDLGIDIDRLYNGYVTYYLKIAKNSKDPWDEITIEFDNISNAADWVADQLNVDVSDELARLAHEYVCALNEYIYRRAIQQGLRWLLAGVVACKKLNKERDEAILYNEIGLRYGSQGNYQEALKWYEKSIKIKEEIGDIAGLATTYNNIGMIHYAQGNYQEAVEWYEKSIKICEKIGDQKVLATTYNNIGEIYDAQGNYQEALKWGEKSKEILEEIGDMHHLAMCLTNIALLYRDTQKKDKARQYLNESYKLYLQLNLKSEAEKVKQLLEEL